MRKKILFIIAIATFGFAFSNTNNSVSTTSETYFIKADKTFTFVENGITFSVFQNGEFDFYMPQRNRVYTNVNLGAINITYNSGYNYDAYLQYDDYGAIVQVETVPVFYDYYGRVSRIGNIRINYRANRLASIGGLHVYYNHYGHFTHYSGYINTYNRNYAYSPYHDYFVRPVYNRCVVSYQPYRQYYKPYRYDYYKGKKKHHKHKTYRHIDARVRVAHTDKNRGPQKYKGKDRKNTNYVSTSVPVKRSHTNTSRNSRQIVKKSNTPQRDSKQIKSRNEHTRKTVADRSQNSVRKLPAKSIKKRVSTVAKQSKKGLSNKRPTQSRSNKTIAGRSI